jgi:hypothetical protein
VSYQFDLQAGRGGNGAIVESKGRGTFASGGQKTVAPPGGRREAVQVVGSTGVQSGEIVRPGQNRASRGGGEGNVI